MVITSVAEIVSGSGWITKSIRNGSYLFVPKNANKLAVYLHNQNGDIHSISLITSSTDGAVADVCKIGNYYHTAQVAGGIVAYSFDGVSLPNEGSISLSDSYSAVRVGTDGTYIYAYGSSSGSPSRVYALSFNGSTYTEIAHIDGVGFREMCVKNGVLFFPNYPSSICAYTFNGSTFSLLDTYSYVAGDKFYPGGIDTDGTYLYVCSDYHEGAGGPAKDAIQAFTFSSTFSKVGSLVETNSTYYFQSITSKEGYIILPLVNSGYAKLYTFNGSIFNRVSSIPIYGSLGEIIGTYTTVDNGFIYSLSTLTNSIYVYHFGDYALGTQLNTVFIP